MIFGCIAARAQQGVRGVLKGLLIAQPYAFYSWLLWPVLVRSVFRQLTERRDWTKTEREPLDSTTHPAYTRVMSSRRWPSTAATESGGWSISAT